MKEIKQVIVAVGKIFICGLFFLMFAGLLLVAMLPALPYHIQNWGN